MGKIEIILADGDSLFSDALNAALSVIDDFHVSAAGAGMSGLREVLLREGAICVIHRQIPDAETIHMLREFHRAKKEVRALLIVKETTGELLSLAGENPGIGVMSSLSTVAELVVAIRALSRGDRYIGRKILSEAGNFSAPRRLSDPLGCITPREREVLYWLAIGLSNKEISKKMILSEKTIKNHVSHILKKLDLTDRTKAAALAWREGLPQISEDFYAISSAEAMLK